MPVATFLNGRPNTRLRGLAFLSLSEAGNVLTRTNTTDIGGGATVVWAAGPAIPCRIDPVTDRGQARLAGGRLDERSTHVVTVPAGTPVSTDNRFVITGRGTFEITATEERTAEMLRTFEALRIS